jgi:hypothetical protein
LEREGELARRLVNHILEAQARAPLRATPLEADRPAVRAWASQYTLAKRAG